MAEILYLSLLCVCHTITYINLLIINKTKFEVLTLCYCISLVVTILGFYLYKKEKKNNSRRMKKKLRFDINMRKMSICVLIIIIISIITLKLTGVGMAATTVVSTTKLDKLKNVFDINAIIWIYYFLGRDRYNKKIFWINIILYFIYEIMCGWTGFIMSFFFFELYFWLKKRNLENKKITVIRIGICIILSFLLIFAGGLLYQYLQPLKFAIRTGTKEWEILPLNIGIKNLTERISYLNDSVRTIEKLYEILEFYIKQGNIWLETKAVFKPFVPRFIMPNKNFMNMANCIGSGFLGVAVINTSISISSPLHLFLLFYIDYRLGIIQMALFFAILFINIKLFRNFEYYLGQFDFLIFMTIMRFASSANLEGLFTQTYAKWIYLFPVFILLGIVKISRKSNVNIYYILERKC